MDFSAIKLQLQTQSGFAMATFFRTQKEKNLEVNRFTRLLFIYDVIPKTKRRTDHYFLEERTGRPEGGKFPKQISCTVKLLRKQIVQISCTVKLLRNRARVAMGKKIELVLSTIQVLFLMFKKVLAQAIAHQKRKIMHNLRARKQFYASENCPTPFHPPPQRIMVRF